MLTPSYSEVEGHFGVSLEPIEASTRQAMQAWWLIHRNRDYLRSTLPGVVETNRTPLDTYRRFKRIVERDDREGYVITQNEDSMCIGVLTLLLKNRKEVGGKGIQIDYWLSPERSRRTDLGLHVAHLAVERAREVTEELLLPAHPHALLLPDVENDPSKELSKVMMKVGRLNATPGDSDFNGIQNVALDVWQDFNVDPKTPDAA